MEVIDAIRFNLDSTEDVERMLVHLKDFGYCVISSVANEKEIEAQKIHFWEYLERMDVGISRSDCSTWDNDRWMGNKSTGIIRQPDFCHSEFMWNARLLPKVKQAFSYIWNTQDLLVSFDAGNAFRPWKINRSWLTEGNWWHVDQNSCKGAHRRGMVCVQGLVTFYDVTRESGGLCVIPGSHIFHDEFCKRSPSSKLMHDYVYIPEDDPVMKVNSPVIIGAKAGDLVLWDSRLVHCNTPSPLATLPPSTGEESKLIAGDWIELPEETKDSDYELVGETVKSSSSSEKGQSTESEAKKAELIRLVSYVTMLPRSFASPAAIRSRKRGFLFHSPTSHWPTQVIEGLDRADSADAAEVIDWRHCPAEKLRLIGYSNLEIQLRKWQLSEFCRELFRAMA